MKNALNSPLGVHSIERTIILVFKLKTVKQIGCYCTITSTVENNLKTHPARFDSSQMFYEKNKKRNFNRNFELHKQHYL